MVFQKIKKEKKFQIMININHGEKKNFQENQNTLQIIMKNMKYIETLIKKIQKYIMKIQKIFQKNLI